MSVRSVARATARLAAGFEAPRERHRHPLDPRHLARAGLLTARFAAEAFEGWRRGPKAQVTFAELDDKVLAFQLFEAGGRMAPGPDGASLGAALERATGRFGPDDVVWVAEGVGYQLQHGAPEPRGTGPLSGLHADVPPGLWCVLHTGMGMALAETGLERRLDEPGGGLAAYVELCQRLARPGLSPLLFEPLGLVARLLQPARVARLADGLRALGGPWAELFWHGLGRGLYFLPSFAAPARSAPWAGVGVCEREAPDRSARDNALAGFAWAVTLVNLRRPEVVESFLVHHVPGPRHPGAQGVASALSLWHAASGGSRALRRFLAHVASPAARGLWRDVVVAPFRAEAETGGEGPGRVAELFRYREPA